MDPTARVPPKESDSVVDTDATTAQSAVVAPSTPLTDKSAKPLAPGLVNGQLPTPDALRSQPRSTLRPEIQAGLAARSSRAAPLDRRLETHIAQLQLEAKSASPDRRQALERDIAILEAQLNARRGWESPAGYRSGEKTQRMPAQ
jgi:hypothetical protein